jgi:toxin HigB-1
MDLFNYRVSPADYLALAGDLFWCFGERAVASLAPSEGENGLKATLTTDNSRFTLCLMIRSFRHRWLKRLYERDDRSGIRPDLVNTIQEIVTVLDEAATPQELALPGYRLHRLKGNLKGFWSVTVRANWRIIFRFEGTDAFDVELIDYH